MLIVGFINGEEMIPPESIGHPEAADLLSDLQDQAGEDQLLPNTSE